MQTGNFNSLLTEKNTSPPYAGTYNNGASEIGQYANTGSSGNTPGAAAFQTLTTTGNGTTGTVRALQVGDTFTITANASAPSAGGYIGVSFRDSTTYADFFSATDSATEARFQLNSGSNWQVYASSNVTSGSAGGTDRTFVIKITSSTTFDAQVGGTWYYNNTMADGGGSIDSFAIYTYGDANADSTWKSASLANTGTVEVGYALATNQTFTPGVIADGLAADSTSTTSANAVYVGGDLGSKVVLDQSNTYTGATAVNSNAAALVANANAFGTTAGGVTVAGRGSILLSNNIAVGNEALTLNGLGNTGYLDGTLASVSGSNSWAGNISINAAEVRLMAYSGTTLALGGTVSSATNRTLYIGGTGTTIISNALSGFNNNFGNGAIWKDYSGNLIFLGDNTGGLTGRLLLREGTITITNANSLGTGTLELGRSTDTATLQVNDTTTRTNAVAIADASTAGVINVTNGKTFTINANLSNTNSGTTATTKFGKAGAGTLVLGGTASTYAGQIQIGDGVVVLANSSALGTNASTANRGIDLGLNVGDVNQTNNVALLLSNGVTVSNSIYVSSNTNSATRTIGMAGTGSAILNNEIYLDGSLTADSGASGNNLAFSGNLINTGGIIKTGAGTATLAGANTYSGTTTVNAGTLALTNGVAIADAGIVTLSNNAGAALAVNTSETIGSLSGGGASGGNVSLNGSGVTLTINDSGAQTYSGAISGTGALTKSGSAAFTLGGSIANTFSGTTTVNGGTLQLQKTAGVNAIAANITVGDASGSDVLLLLDNNQIADTSVITLNGTVANQRGAFRLNGFSETIGGLSGDGLVEANSGVAGSAGSSLILSNAASTSHTYNGLIRNTGGTWTGTLSLTKTGSGTQIFGSNNTYTGATTISAGTLQIGNGGAAGSLSTSSTITNNGVLAINRSDSVAQGTIFANGISGTGSLVQAGAGTLTLGAANTYSGGTVVSAGQLNINHAGAIGAGTLTLSNGAKFANTSGGAISNANNNAISINGTNTFASGTLDMGTGAVSIGGTSRLIVSSGSLTLGGNLGGSAAFNKDGIGTLTLAGSNSMTSYTVIDYGVLNLGNVNALANAHLYLYGTSSNKLATFGVAGANTYNIGALSSSSTGILSLGANSINIGAANLSTTYGGVIEGTGAVTKSGAGTLVLSGANNYIGGTLLSAGTLKGDTTSLQGAITNNAAAIFDTATNGTYAGVMSGTGTFAKSGAGTLTLTATNTYSGATTVEAGKLVVSGAIASSAVTVTNAGTLGGSGSVGDLVIADGGTLAPGNSPGTLFAASATWTNGGSYDWEILDAAGTAGATNGWDLLDVAGTLTLTGLTNSAFTINLITLSDSTTPGPMANFNSSSNYSWMIARAATNGIVGFNASMFNLYAGAFSNAYTGSFGITKGLYEGDDALFLTYSGGGQPVPEPGTWVAAALLCAAALTLRLRREARA